MELKKMKGWGRRDLYREFWSQRLINGAEIGVQRGRNAEMMLEEIPDLTLTLVEPYANHFAGYRQWKPEDLRRFRKQARRRLAGKNVIWRETFSECAACSMSGEKFDFVYIDGDHSFDFVMQDIIVWGRLVRKGGIVSGHDYYYRLHGRKSVRKAVDTYCKYHGIETLYTTDPKVNNDKGDQSGSWWFYKPVEVWRV